MAKANNAFAAHFLYLTSLILEPILVLWENPIGIGEVRGLPSFSLFSLLKESVDLDVAL